MTLITTSDHIRCHIHRLSMKRFDFLCICWFWFFTAWYISSQLIYMIHQIAACECPILYTFASWDTACEEDSKAEAMKLTGAPSKSSTVDISQYGVEEMAVMAEDERNCVKQNTRRRSPLSVYCLSWNMAKEGGNKFYVSITERRRK